MAFSHSPRRTAPRRFERAGVLAQAMVAAGAIALVVGLAFLTTSLAPMFQPRDETAIAGAPATSVAGVAAAGVNTSVLDSGGTAMTAALDRPVDGVAFAMRIPVLRYRATVYEGVDDKTLLRGPGHYPSSPWPGNPGNVAIAAHNVFWLSFAQLKAGDRVELLTRRGLFVYVITGSKVTSANDRQVLAPTTDRRLTLTTCSPLWAGALATKRLVFFATGL